MLVLLPWLQVIGVYAWIPLSASSRGCSTGSPASPPAAVGPAAGLAGVGRRRPGCWSRRCGRVVPFGGFPWGRLAFAVEDTPRRPDVRLRRRSRHHVRGGPARHHARVGGAAASDVRPVRAVAGVALAAVAWPAWRSLLPWQTPRRRRRSAVAAVQGNVPGEGLEAFAERRAVLDNHVQATFGLAARIDAGHGAAARTWWCGRRTPPTSTPTPTPAPAPAIGDGRRGGRRAAADGRRRRRPGRPAAGSTGRSSGRPDRAARGSTTTRPTRCRSGSTSRCGRCSRRSSRPWTRSPATWSAAPARACCSVGPARAGVLMCFEVAYDGLVRDVVDGGADVIVVPTNNATYTGTGQIEQQFAMSRLRAIETGRYVVVASTNGISGIVAPGRPRGRSGRPAAAAGGAGAGRSAGHRPDPGDRARVPGPSGRCRRSR